MFIFDLSIFLQGKIFYYHGIIVLILFVVGFILLMKAIKTIKKLKLDNERLIKRGKYLVAIYNQVPIGVIFGNDKHKLVDCNPMFEKITGRSKKELRSLSWKEYTHPDDVMIEMELFWKFVNKEINYYNITKRYIKANGEIVWVNLSMAPIEIQSLAITHIGIVQDVTERVLLDQALKESERSKATLLKNLPGMAYRCHYDRSWTMEFVSDGCYEITGYKPESLLYNRDISYNDLICPEYQEYLWNKWGEILTIKEYFKNEYEIITASGERKWVYEQGCGVYDEDGNVIAIEGLVIDISQQKQREAHICYLNNHDLLTGLYNRHYFEETISRIDAEPNLPISIIIGDINGLKLVNEAYGTDKGDELLNSVAKILKKYCQEADILTRIGGDEFALILPNTSYQYAQERIRVIEQACSTHHNLSLSLGCATKKTKFELISNTIKDAEDNMLLNKLLKSHSFHSNLIASLKATLYAESQETDEHAQRLIKYSQLIGKDLNLSETTLNELELLCTLHDIGKIGIDDRILKKAGPLTNEEWEQMKRHPEIGYRIAMASPELRAIAPYILCHHERWDGSGYPQGLKGEEIPLTSRIIAVIDAFDAMTNERCYQATKSFEEAIQELKDCAGTQFDPHIVNAFIKVFTEIN